MEATSYSHLATYSNSMVCTLVYAAWWCNGCGVGLVIKRSQVQIPSIPPSVNDPGQVVHTHVPLSSSSIIWYWPKGGDTLMPITHAPETGTENWYQFSGTSFSYQMKLEAKFLD